MSIFLQSSNSKQPKTKNLAAINKVNFAWEENLPYSLQYLPIHLPLKPIHLNPYSFLMQKCLNAKKQKTKIPKLS